MPFNPALRNISPLAWCLGASAVANVVTMLAVLYLASGTPKVYVSAGSIDAYIRGTPLSVQIVR
jgi:hypothetical protein